MAQFTSDNESEQSGTVDYFKKDNLLFSDRSDLMSERSLLPVD
jgi:hypothetical protein